MFNHVIYFTGKNYDNKTITIVGIVNSNQLMTLEEFKNTAIGKTVYS